MSGVRGAESICVRYESPVANLVLSVRRWPVNREQTSHSGGMLIVDQCLVSCDQSNLSQEKSVIQRSCSYSSVIMQQFEK